MNTIFCIFSMMSTIIILGLAQTVNAQVQSQSSSTNATGTALKEAQDILRAAENATANATSELINRADNVLSLASDDGANATQTAMNKTMDLLSNMSRNVSEIVLNTLSEETELDDEFDDNSGVGYYDPPYSYAQCLTVFTKEQCDFRFK